ncbi:MAG: efflux RND transporter periplasmic adaptor subunit [Chloroflexota bacterium]|nr:efflux RND transporter periplasmic adaptor subunit [Chloroflexota bacterium]
MSERFQAAPGQRSPLPYKAERSTTEAERLPDLPTSPLPVSEAALPRAEQQNTASLVSVTADAPQVRKRAYPQFAFPSREGRYPRQSPGRGKNGRWVLVTLLASLVLLGALVFTIMQLSKATQDVTVYQIKVQDVTGYVGGGGIIFPRQQLDLSYPVSERVVSLFVQAGESVSTNQALMQLDPEQLTIQVKQAADEVDAAQAYLNTVSASGNRVSVAQAQQQYRLAKSRYNALVAQTSSPLLHAGNVISPMNGVITAINVNAGEVFAADAPLLTIMDEAAVIVHVKIPLANLGQVSPGQPALVTPSALPDLTMAGKVISIIPQADPQTDTFEVWVQVDNSAKKLLPGMSAFVRIQSASRAAVVPRMAVLDPGHGSLVFIVNEQHAYLRQVHVMGRSVDSLYIDAGLGNGDRVVLIGLDRLRDGQPVHVVGTERLSV